MSNDASTLTGTRGLAAVSAPSIAARPNTGADFCVFSSARAGGSLLVEDLDAHPQVTCHGEVFHNKRLPLPMNYKLLLQRDYDSKRQHDPYAFLADLRRVSRTVQPQKPLMGFEVLPGQGDRVWRRFAADPALRKILVRRDNKLAQYAAALRGQIHLSPGAGAGAIQSLGRRDSDHKPVFDAPAFEHWLAELQRYETAICGEAAPAALITVSYADVLRGDLGSELWQRLGVRPVAARRARAPAAGGTAVDVAERFSDPQAVRMTMQQRGSEHWLHEA